MNSHQVGKDIEHLEHVISLVSGKASFRCPIGGIGSIPYEMHRSCRRTQTVLKTLDEALLALEARVESQRSAGKMLDSV